MKHVWKCDFCSSTNSDATAMENHEASCYWNPINKKCVTCHHHAVCKYDGVDECTLDKGWSLSNPFDDGVIKFRGEVPRSVIRKLEAESHRYCNDFCC